MVGFVVNISTSTKSCCGKYPCFPLLFFIYSSTHLIQAKAELLSVPWQDIKKELAVAVDEMKRGYWSRHRKNSAATAAGDSRPDALEVDFRLVRQTLHSDLTTKLPAKGISSSRCHASEDCLHKGRFPKFLTEAIARAVQDKALNLSDIVAFMQTL